MNVFPRSADIENPRMRASRPGRSARRNGVATAAAVALVASLAALSACSREELPTDPIVLNEEVVRTAQHGSASRLRALIEAGGDATQRDFLGWTPLHYAVNRFRTESWNDLEPVEVLLSTPGVDVDSRANNGAYPLLIAAEHGRIDLFELLVARGADMTLRKGDPTTVLAAALRDGRHEMVRHLLSKGVDVNERLPGGGNALFIALRAKDLTAMRILIDAGVDIHGGVHGAAPIVFAPALRNPEVVRLLVEAGADVNTVNPVNGLTPLHRAVGSGAEMVKLLLDLGARPGVSNQEGFTPLDYARERGDQEVIRLLTAARDS